MAAPRVNPQVVSTPLPSGEVVLLHLGSKATFTLNETAACIWRLLSEGQDLTSVARLLTSEFTVDAEGASRAVEALVQELTAADLISG